MRVDEEQIVECQTCKKVVLRKSFNQKYCERCSEIAHLETKSKYRKKNKIGSWMVNGVNIDILLSFSVPFSFHYSKNAIWGLSRERGHIFVRKEVNELRENMARIVRESGVKWRVNKVYLDILVQKPSLRGDAINVIDTIADAIKGAIGLDDNWFSIRRLDWESVKNDPRIFVGIGQENEDKYPCNVCGGMKTFDCFPRNKSSQFGITVPCKECSRELRSRVREYEKNRENRVSESKSSPAHSGKSGGVESDKL